VTLVGLGVAAGAAFLLGAATALAALVGPLSQRRPAAAGAAVLVASALLTVPLLLPPVRARLSRLLPIDPRSYVHATALVYCVLLVGMQAYTEVSSDVLAEQARLGPVLTPLDLVLQETPFLVAALVGVGIYQRRTPALAAARLGWVRPAWWQLVLALAAAGAFYAFSSGMDWLGMRLTPDLSRKVSAATDRLFGGLNNPVGIATLALAAGIAEEALFRGALQPKLGILATSVVFASVHTQYGFSFDTLAVFVLSCALGVIRRFYGTTTSTACHVAYNALAGIGVGGALVAPAVAVELLAVLVAAGGYASSRRRLATS
jgi:CAAX protease family protein